MTGLELSVISKFKALFCGIRCFTKVSDMCPLHSVSQESCY